MVGTFLSDFTGLHKPTAHVEKKYTEQNYTLCGEVYR